MLLYKVAQGRLLEIRNNRHASTPRCASPFGEGRSRPSAKPDADMKHTANVSVSPTHKPGGVRTDDTRSHQANDSQPNTVGRPLRWRTSSEIRAESLERAGAPRSNTTAC